MKKYLIIILAIINVMFIFSCNKKSDPDPINTTAPPKTDNNNNTFNNTPEAKSEEDNKSGGVYKGVLMGSSGTIKITLQDNNVFAVITFDGVTKTLTTNSLAGWTSGQAISDAIFTADDWELIFSVDADGQNPDISVTIPGHTVAVVLIKETSLVLVRTFEGVYVRGDTTSFALNCVITGNEVDFIGLTSKGTLTGNTINLNAASEKGFRLTGYLNYDVINGTGNSVQINQTLDPENNVTYDTVEVAGTWNANRTL